MGPPSYIGPIAEAFRSEADKVLNSLKDGFSSGENGNISHHKTTLKLLHLVHHYKRKLPLAVWSSLVGEYGEKLRNRSESALALDLYSLASDPGDQVVDKGGAMGTQLKMNIGKTLCDVSCCLSIGGHGALVQTLRKLYSSPAELIAAIKGVGADPSMYWLVYNTSVVLYEVACCMMVEGYWEAALPFLLQAIVLLESNPVFSHQLYTEWKRHLYGAVCGCYRSLGQGTAAMSLLEKGCSHTDQIFQWLQLDPRPLPKERTVHLEKFRRYLEAMQLTFKVLEVPEGMLLQELQALLPGLDEQLEVLLESLSTCQHHTLRQTSPTDSQKKLLAVVQAVFQPHLSLGISPACEDNGTMCGPAHAQALPLTQLERLLCIAYNLKEQQLLESVLKVAQHVMSEDRTGEGPVGLVALVQVLQAIMAVQTTSDATTLKALSDVLLRHCQHLATHKPNLLTDAALILFLSARPWLATVTHTPVERADDPMRVLSALHQVMVAVDLPDVLLVGEVAMKLSWLLERSKQMEPSLQVLDQAIGHVERYRARRQEELQGVPGASGVWITASKTQERGSRAPMVAAMTATDQEVSCLHADLVTARFRVQLQIGAQSKLRKVEDGRAARSPIMRDQKIRAEDVASQVHGKQLQQACGYNMYEQCLLSIQMALSCQQRARQGALLNQAGELLQQAKQYEEDLFAYVDQVNKIDAVGSPMVAILSVTPSSVTLRDVAIQSSGLVTYCCRTVGAGTALSLSKGTIEFPGTGIPRVPGTIVQIEGLQRNEHYFFACAPTDAEGQSLGNLGASTPRVILALPLPIHLCWCKLLVVAARLGHVHPTKQSARVMLNQFVLKHEELPLWHANPMDQYQLKRGEVQKATRPLLRAFAHGLYAYVGTLHKTATTGLRNPPHDCSAHLAHCSLPHQMMLLKDCKYLLIGITVCSLLEDEWGVLEGVVRVHNLLVPLLAARTPSIFIHKALAQVFQCLRLLNFSRPASSEIQNNQRQIAAQVAAAITYHLLQMTRRLDEAKVKQYLTWLDMGLMQLLEIPFQTTTAGDFHEGQCLRDLLLQLSAFATSVGTLSPWIAPALKDPGDLVALVLPNLDQSRSHSSCWSHLNTEAARQHPRWVELCVRLVEAVVRQGGDPEESPVKEIVQQVTWFVRLKCRVPVVDWEACAAISERTGPANPPVVSKPSGKKPQLEQVAEGISDEDKKRLPSVIFLQRTLPLLLAKKAQLLSIRQLAPAWALWMSRLHTVLALTGIPVPGTRGDQLPTKTERPLSSLGLDQAAKQQATPEKTSPPNKGTKKGLPKPIPAASPPVSQETPGATSRHQKVFEAILSLCRAVALAGKAACNRGWLQQLSASRHMYNTLQLALKSCPSLAEPTPRCTWELGFPPTTPLPPDELQVLWQEGNKLKVQERGDPSQAANATGKKGTATKGSGAPPKPSKSPAKKSTMTQDDSPAKPSWIARASSPSIGQALVVAAEAVITSANQWKRGSCVFTMWIEEPAPEGEDNNDGQSESSGFSLGSDREQTTWFNGKGIDMQFCTHLLVLMMGVLCQMGRWGSALKLAEGWMEVTDGFYHDRLQPLVLEARQHMRLPGDLTGTAKHISPHRSQAVLQLNQVRLMVRENLRSTDVSGASRHTGPLTETIDLSALPVREPQPVTGTSGSQQSTLLMEYDLVIAALKKHNEKVLLVQAMNERGDLCAHYGRWQEACQWWRDALDTLLGPYQVLSCWRKSAVATMSGPELLHQYGIHGLLLAGGVLLGKLVAHGYPDDLHLQEEASLLAAHLLPAVFCHTITHPQRNVDFGTYVPEDIWEGQDIFQDPYRCNISDLCSGLTAIIQVLLDSSMALSTLPLLSLREHLGQVVRRDVRDTCWCRVMKIRALSQCGLVEGAIQVLVDLMHGLHLPCLASPTGLVVYTQEGAIFSPPPSPPAFISSRTPSHPDNQGSLTFLLEAVLPVALRQLYGPWLSALSACAHAEVLLLLVETTAGMKEMDKEAGARLRSTCTSLLDKASELLVPTLPAAIAHEYDTSTSPPTGKGKPKRPPASAKSGTRSSIGTPDASQVRGSGSERPLSAVNGSEEGELEDGAMSQEALLQHSQVADLALHLMAKCERLRCQSHSCLQCTLHALKNMAQQDYEATELSPGVENLMRWKLGPRSWLRAREKVVVALQDLHHHEVALHAIQMAVSEATSLNSLSMMARLKYLAAGSLAVLGKREEALAGYREAVARSTQLAVHTVGHIEVLLTAGDYMMDCGLRHEAESLWQQCCEVTRGISLEHGLKEVQVHPELATIYLTPLPLYLHVLQRLAGSSERSQHYTTGIAHMDHMLQLLPHVPQSASQRAEVLYTAARIRWRTAQVEGVGDEDGPVNPPTKRPYKEPAGNGGLKKTASSSTVSDKPALTGATTQAPPAMMPSSIAGVVDILKEGLQWAALSGGCCWKSTHRLLLEMASLAVLEQEVHRAARCLHLAHVATTKGQQLQMSCKQLLPVDATQLPSWLIKRLTTQEQYFDHKQGRENVEVKKDDVGLLALAFLRNLLTLRCSASYQGARHVQRMVVLLHEALQVASPKYCSCVCWPEAPLPEDNPPVMEAGACRVQWYLHHGEGDHDVQNHKGEVACRINPMSPHLEGKWALMLYAVSPTTSPSPIAPICGELVVYLDEVLALQRKVTTMKQRLENPKNPDDIFGCDAASDKEVQEVKEDLERWLSGGVTLAEARQDLPGLEATGSHHPLLQEGTLVHNSSRQPAATVTSEPGTTAPKRSSMTATRKTQDDVQLNSTEPFTLKEVGHWRLLEEMMDFHSGISVQNIPFSNWMYPLVVHRSRSIGSPSLH